MGSAAARGFRCTLLAAALAGCSPWTVLNQADPSPLRGQKMIAMLPLDWAGVAIDDRSEQDWNADNDAQMKLEWVADKQLAADEFLRGLLDEAKGRLQVVPGAAPLTVKSFVSTLKTGGPFRPLLITIRVQLLDAQGAVLEEISTTVKQSKGKWRIGLFQNRLTNASREAGANAAAYLVKRAEAD